MIKKILFLLGVCLSTSVLADETIDQQDLNISATNETTNQQDPYENFNRHTFKMNDTLDKYFLKPVATLYLKIVPKPLERGINNVFNNIWEPSTVANDLLQGNVHYAVHDTWRFFINTTLGIGGLFDMATRMNILQHKNDFGLTMAKWGYQSSAYFIIPFYGPSTIRDTIGIIPDYYVFSIYPYINPKSLRYSILIWEGVNDRAQLLQYENILEAAALDPYVFQRDAYLQHRRYVMQQDNDDKTLTDEPSSDSTSLE